MTDLRETIAPKSDQMNSDDLIGRTLTITVTKVSRCAEAEQPIAIHFDGDNGKPYKPCKSMRRVLVQLWGPDGQSYVGRSMTLYRDDKVVFGGVAVGGIRISHMSHITKDVTMALTATRANRKPFTVKPLLETSQSDGAKEKAAAKGADALVEAFDACPGEMELSALLIAPKTVKQRDWLQDHFPDLSTRVEEAITRAAKRLDPARQTAEQEPAEEPVQEAAE